MAHHTSCQFIHRTDPYLLTLPIRRSRWIRNTGPLYFFRQQLSLVITRFAIGKPENFQEPKNHQAVGSLASPPSSQSQLPAASPFSAFGLGWMDTIARAVGDFTALFSLTHVRFRTALWLSHAPHATPPPSAGWPEEHLMREKRGLP